MLDSWGTPGGAHGVLVWWVLMGAHGVLMGCSFGVRWGCSWWVGAMLDSWGAPGGACGVLIWCEMVHHSAKRGMWVLVDAHGVLVGAHGVLVWHVMVHCSARGRSFSQGESGGEVSDEDERENAVEPLNVMCPGCQHLLPNAAIFNVARDLAKVFLGNHVT